MFSIANTTSHQCIIDEAKPPVGVSFYIVKCSCGWVCYDSSIDMAEYNNIQLFDSIKGARNRFITAHIVLTPIEEWAIVNEF